MLVRICDFGLEYGLPFHSPERANGSRRQAFFTVLNPARLRGGLGCATSYPFGIGRQPLAVRRLAGGDFNPPREITAFGQLFREADSVKPRQLAARRFPGLPAGQFYRTWTLRWLA